MAPIAVPIWIAGIVYAIAALVLLHDIRKHSVPQLYPLVAYFLGTALSLALTSFAPLSAIAVVIGSCALVRLPLSFESRHRDMLSAIVFSLSLVLAAYGLSISDKFLLFTAHLIALVLVTFVGLYILFAGIRSVLKEQSMVTGGLLLVLGIVAHVPAVVGLYSGAVQLVITLLSPLSLILALYLGRHMTH